MRTCKPAIEIQCIERMQMITVPCTHIRKHIVSARGIVSIWLIIQTRCYIQHICKILNFISRRCRTCISAPKCACCNTCSHQEANPTLELFFHMLLLIFFLICFPNYLSIRFINKSNLQIMAILYTSPNILSIQLHFFIILHIFILAF